MTRQVGYHWHLRRLMAERGMFATTDLVPLLAERGVSLSREQVYRLVVRVPERLNLTALAALCDILDCSPAEPRRALRRRAREREGGVDGPGAADSATASTGRAVTRHERR